VSGLVIDEAYGMTEVGLVTMSPPSGEIRMGSVGQVMPAISLAIRDEVGAELAAGAEGRLWIRSPAVMVGYWEDPGATEAVLSDGWFDSGDGVRVDEEGDFYFCGGREQIIGHPGSNIFPRGCRSPR